MTVDAIVAKNRSGASGMKAPLLIRGSYARIVSRAA